MMYGRGHAAEVRRRCMKRGRSGNLLVVFTRDEPNQTEKHESSRISLFVDVRLSARHGRCWSRLVLAGALLSPEDLRKLNIEGQWLRTTKLSFWLLSNLTTQHPRSVESLGSKKGVLSLVSQDADRNSPQSQNSFVAPNGLR